MSPYPFSEQWASRSLNVYDQLLQKRLIFINQVLEGAIANQIIATMLYLDAEDPDQDIRLCINTSGGTSHDSVVAAMAIYDTMRCLDAGVSTVCTGMAAAAGAFLLAVGTQGKRLALPHARIQLTQPTRIIPENSVTDLSIGAKELLHLRQKVTEIIAQRTGQSIEKIVKDTDRSVFLSAQEAQAYGLIDQVISH